MTTKSKEHVNAELQLLETKRRRDQAEVDIEQWKLKHHKNRDKLKHYQAQHISAEVDRRTLEAKEREAWTSLVQKTHEQGKLQDRVKELEVQLKGKEDKMKEEREEREEDMEKVGLMAGVKRDLEGKLKAQLD